VPDTLELRTLAAQFARARIPLRLATAGFVRGVDDQHIVQMDVQRIAKQGRTREEVVIWPGDATEMRVLGIDAQLQQLVLLVHEPPRSFAEHRQEPGGRHINTLRHTPGFRRRFLVGMDERHLFIAPLATPATTVRDAHEQLQPPVVVEARQRGRRVRRQGEWFFLGVTAEERAAITAHIEHHGVEHGVGLGWMGRSGRPHLAAERIHIERRDERHRLLESCEYARGRIVHPDHHSLHLRDWMRVERNTEDQSGGPGASRWID
jgi:hypothetical protein